MESSRSRNWLNFVNVRQKICVFLIVFAFTGCYTTTLAKYSEEIEPVEDSSSVTTIEIGSVTLPMHMQTWFNMEIHRFMEANPDIKVLARNITSPVRPYDKTIGEIQELPKNIIGFQTYFGNEVDYLASRNLIVSVDSFLPDTEFSYDQFYDNAFTGAQYKGKSWGVPLFMDTFFLMYDKRSFKKAGLTGPPATWDEFLSYCEALTVDLDGDGVVDQWGVYIPPVLGIETNLWTTLDRQLGVSYIVDGEVNYDQPVIRKNLTFIRDFLVSKNTDKSMDPTFGLPVGHNNSAMMIMNNFVQHLDYVNQGMKVALNNPNFGIAPLPTDGKAVTSSGYRIYLAVRKSTKEEEAASWRLIKWFNRDDVTIPGYWYGYPVAKKILERPELQRVFESGPEGYENLFTSMDNVELSDVRYGMNSAFLFLQLLDPFFQGQTSIDSTIYRLNQNRSQLAISQAKN
jgi:ABC-type glycerol-3-phosphate transport system substrate-binding protein